MSEPLAVRVLNASELVSVLRQARKALDGEATSCRYHGTKFDFSGWESWSREQIPRCDSCKQPYAVTNAIASIDRALRGEYDDSTT
jgi:hypothetical protein